MVVLISAQCGAVATFEQVGSRAMILVQGSEKRLPLRTVLQSCRVLNGGDGVFAQLKQLCMAFSLNACLSFLDLL